MGRRLKAGPSRRKASQGLEVEAFLHVLRTGDTLMQGLAATLKPAGLSPVQYNVLRILRGGGPQGLSCREIGERMLTRDPDITRLLDRLEDRALVIRSRGREDRRCVTTQITEDGLRVLRELDGPVAALHTRQLGHLGRERLVALIALLESARPRAG